MTEEKSIGINLSAEVYDIDGESQENAIWIDGKMTPLSGVVFQLPKNLTYDPWKISSRNTDEVNLMFHPLGSREDHSNFYIIQNDFVQPYGKFFGSITVTDSEGILYEITIEDSFGVVESHSALW